MATSLLLLVLAALFAFGGRAQLVVGHISDALADEDRTRRPIPLLATGVVCAALSAWIMAYAGSYATMTLPEETHPFLITGALGLAALELAWPVRAAPLREPTRSLGAIGAVLLVRQLGDAARLIIFAAAIWTRDPMGAALAGGIGGSLAAGMGWKLGAQKLAEWPLRWIRACCSVPLILAALLIGLNVS
ncbi:MAG: hypothetical protein AAFY51_08515 [Pseudomonadota bacterium]